MKQRIGHIDIFVFLSVLALMLFSIGLVYSASAEISGMQHKGDTSYLFRSHAIRVALGIIALFAGMMLDYHVYAKWSKFLLLIGILLLGATLLGGFATKGAQRWVGWGQMRFQPSEFAKFALIIHLAVLLAAKQDYIRDFKRGYLPLLVWVGIVVVLVFFQPNFSTGALILGISFLLLFIGRVKVAHMVSTVVMGLPLVFVYAVSESYRMKRLLAHFTGDDVVSAKVTAAKYQIEQAVIGLGNGGILGVGMGMSKQRELFLPESYTDFIFAIVGEEYGLIGTLIILGLFVLILIRGVKIAKHAPDDLGRFLAAGITIVIVMYALVNAMVTTGLAPTTGLPMPFLSYGGTAIMFSAYAVGILLNISMQTSIRPRVRRAAAQEPGIKAGELYDE